MQLTKIHPQLKFLQPYFFLFLILFISYLPLSTLHFAMKNDAFSDNFPDKYFLSQALHTGVFPMWNPYMNFGFPIYADPGFAFWNPVTWLFGLMGYNAYILTVEVLIYLYIAGILMFNLCRFLKFSSNTSLAVAAMYMCSGFFTGSIQYINFLTAAAFLPFLLQSFLKLAYHPAIKTSAIFSIACYCVLMSGHPAIPVASVYFLIILFLLFCIYNFKNHQFNFKRLIVFFSISFLLTAILAAPMLYSYSSIWHYYARNNAQQNFSITNTGISIASLISFLFPFSTTAHSSLFKNDVAMRNLYFSLFGFICFVFALYRSKKLLKIFFITAIIMLILSLGGSFKECLFNFLPGLKYVRTNGEFRVFVILLFSVISGVGLEKMQAKNQFFLLKRTLRFYTFVCIGIILIILIFFHHSLYEFFTRIKTAGFGLSAIKLFFDKESFLFALLISLLISVLICLPVILLRSFKLKWLYALILIDVIINSILYLPVTGVGVISLSQIQSFYNSNPQGISIPALISINKIDTLDAKATGLVGDISYYNKKIGVTHLTDYPSYFASTDLFFKSSQKNYVFSKPYIFLMNDNAGIRVKKFLPQEIIAEVKSDKADTLVLLQNNYKFWHAYNNKRQVEIKKVFISFMSVPVHPGNNEIEFYYRDDKLVYFVAISFLALIFIIIIIIRNKSTVDLN